MNEFYAYRHIRLDTNIPFYIGKGIGNRAYSKSNRNPYWHRIVNKYGYEVEIMVDGLTEDESLTKERELIKLYKSLGYCDANLTDGGDGISGLKHTEESKIKMSIAKSENYTPWNKGKKEIYSDEVKKKMGIDKIGKTPWNKGLTADSDKRVKEYTEESGKSLRGKKQSPELIEKRASKIRGKPSGFMGKKHSKESLLKCKESHLGKKYKPMSELGKENIRKAIKAYWERKKYER